MEKGNPQIVDRTALALLAVIYNSQFGSPLYFLYLHIITDGLSLVLNHLIRRSCFSQNLHETRVPS